jgi:hypothetical protein
MPRRNKRRQGRRGRSRNTIGEAMGPRGKPNLGPMVPRKDYLLDNVAGISQSIRRTLVTSFGGTFTQSNTTYTEQSLITLNSAYLPTSAGSAIGYAKYMAFYSKCFVLGARVKVKVTTYLVSEFNPSIMGVTVTTYNTSLGAVGPAVANGLCDWDMVNQNPDHRTFNASIDVSKFFNKPTVLDDPTLFSTVSAAPAQLIFAHFWYQAFVAGANVAWYAELEQDCVFTDPIPFT